MKADDIKLLNEIRKDSRSTLTALAYKTGMPLSTVFKKVIRLERSGIMTRNIALIDFEKIGHPFKVGVFLSTNKREDAEEYLREHPNINTLLKLSGDYDFYAEMIFRDLNQYQEFELAMKNSNIVKRHNLHFLSEIKQEAFEILGDE